MLQPVRTLQGTNQVFMKYHEAQVSLPLRGCNMERYQKELIRVDFLLSNVKSQLRKMQPEVTYIDVMPLITVAFIEG